MKKLIFCLVLILLAIPAAAAEEYQSIADMPVPERWTASWEVGNRTVTVDVQPTIPEVEVMPVVKVVPAFWVPQPRAGAAWTVNVSGLGDAFHLQTENVYTVAGYTGGMMYAPFEEDALLFNGSALTVAGLKSKLAAIFSDMEGEVYGYDTLHVDYLNPHKVKGGGHAVIVNFYQTLRDVPLWDHAINSVGGRADDELNYWLGYTLTMQDEDSYELGGHAVRESAVLAEDVPLCSFDLVKAAVEAEIEAGHIRAVYAIDLGYALYNEPGVTREPGTEWIADAEFYALPAWRVLCIYTANTGKKLDSKVFANPATSMYYKMLFINAQTGELLDPDQTGNGCADYSGFLTWEDVQ